MKLAHITLLKKIDDDVTTTDLRLDIENELGSSIYLDQAETRIVVFGEPASFEWRGSAASAVLLERYVNRIDSAPYRAGASVATASADIEETRIGYNRLDPIRVDRSATCTVDAYDGIHLLHGGDRLVVTADGWRVEEYPDLVKVGDR